MELVGDGKVEVTKERGKDRTKCPESGREAGEEWQKQTDWYEKKKRGSIWLAFAT